MKILNPFSAMLIALQLTPSFSAPVSRNAGPDLIERQSQTSAQGDCTSQSMSGQPATVSGDCGQENTGGTYPSGGSPPAVGSGNRNSTSGGGTTGTSGGTLTGNSRGTTPGNSYGTTGSGPSTKSSGGGTTGNTGGTATGNRYGTTGGVQGKKGSDGASNTNSLKTSGNAAFPPSDEFTNKLKGEDFGNLALPNLDEIFSKVQSEVSGGEIPGRDIMATESRERDLDNQADNSMF